MLLLTQHQVIYEILRSKQKHMNLFIESNIQKHLLFYLEVKCQFQFYCFFNSQLTFPRLIMQTPTKAAYRTLNSSYSPFSSLINSKVSTACDFQRQQSSSLSKKRFARRRQNSNDSQRRLKAFDTDKKIPTKQNDLTPQNAEDSIQKADKLLQKLSLKRDSVFTSKYVKLSTDRSHNNESYYDASETFNLNLGKGNLTARTKTEQNEAFSCSTDYKLELEMKNTEFMILEDENSRLRKQLKSKQTIIDKLEKQRQQVLNDLQQFRRKVNDKVQRLNNAIVQKDKQIEEKQSNIEKHEKLLNKNRQQLRKYQKQIQMLKIHTEQLMTKKLTKNALDIISYREVSLSNQLDQLKEQLNLSKSQRTKMLENQLYKLKQRFSLVTHDYESLTIANRVLTKKNQEVDVSVEKKYRNQMNQLRERVKQLVKESSTLKKENVSLRKTIYQQQSKEKSQVLLRDNLTKRTNRLLTNSRALDHLNKENSSDQSFSISLSK